MNNPEKFLTEKYSDIPGSKPVERAVQKKIREGGKGPQTKEGRVEAYLDWIEQIIASGTRVNDERGWELLKNKLVKEFSIDVENPDTLAKIARGLYESEKKLAIEQGRGADVERLERELDREADIIEKYKGLVKEKHDIQENTKVYVGRLEHGIFDAVQKYNIEYVYTRFPEGKIHRENLEIGGKTAEILEKEMREKGIIISTYAQDMLKSKDFSTLEKPEQITLVRLRVRDLGFEISATTDEIYQKAKKLGLELCPSEVGPHLRIKYTDQPFNEWLIAMKQIPDHDGDPRIFRLERFEGDLRLNVPWAFPYSEWYHELEFIFCLRKLE